jgi:hypothetical protein
MPETTSCPECDKKLKVPENLIGKKVKCPGCSTMFTARAEGVTTGRPAPPRRRDEDEDDDRPRSRRRDDDDDEDRPRGRRDRDDDYDDRRRRRDEDEDRVRSRRYDDEDDRRRRRDDDDDDDYDRRPRNVGALWRGVKGGINLWVMGAWLALGTMGAYIVAIIIVTILGMIVPAAFFLLFAVMILAGLAFLAAGVMMLIGNGLCMQAPNARDHPTRTLAIVSFCCNVAPIVISLLMIPVVLVTGPIGGLLNLFLLPLSVALSLAGMICWVLFLRSCAYQARSRELAERLMNWLVMWLVFMGVMIVLYVVMFVMMIGAGFAGGVAAMGVLGIFFGVIMLAASIFGLCLTIWLIQMASEVRDVVGRKRR